MLEEMVFIVIKKKHKILIMVTRSYLFKHLRNTKFA
jgi:hypothetical protein